MIKNFSWFLIFFVLSFSCCRQADEVTGNKVNQTDGVSTQHKICVTDGNGIQRYCDSTRDVFSENEWLKIIYNNGEVDVTYPYNWNLKGFVTK